jgi:hypothetical protein
MLAFAVVAAWAAEPGQEWWQAWKEVERRLLAEVRERMRRAREYVEVGKRAV